MRTTILSHAMDQIQNLMKEEKDKSVIDADTYNKFRQNQVKALPNIIIKNLKTKKRYLELKDLGNRERTVPDIELAEIERTIIDLTKIDFSLDGSFQNRRRKLIHKLYGIDIASTAEIMGIKDEPKEEEIKEQPAAKDIEVKKVEGKKSKEKETEKVQQPVINKAAFPKIKLPDLPKFKQDIHMTTKEYENQGYHNCWCVAGAALFNRFMGKKLVNQYDMRAFFPSDKEIKSFAEIDRMEQGISEEEYKEIIDEYRTYMGKNCKQFGSIYQAADFFLKQNHNMAVRRMLFAVPSFLKRKDNKVIVAKTEKEEQDDLLLYHQQKVVFLNKLNEVLATGNPVAILDTGKKHYKTITKLDGEWITLLEPKGNIDEKKRIDEVLRRDDESNLIELTWLSKLKDPKDEMMEQPNLNYSDVGGFGLIEPTEENARNPMWVEGVSASIQDSKLHIISSSYLPVKKIEKKENRQEKKKEKKKDTALNIIRDEQTQTMAVPVVENAKKQGSLNVIDGLFKEKSALGDDFCKEYASYLNKVMDSEDFTFDKKGIEALRNKVKEKAEKRAAKKEVKNKLLIPEMVAYELKRFDTLMLPTLEKVCELVNNKVIGKDTARIFLNPIAMGTAIVEKDFENVVYETLSYRSEYEEADDASDRKYRGEVKALVKDLHHHTVGIKLISDESVMLAQSDWCKPDAVMKKDGFVYFGEKRKSGAPRSEADIRCYVTVKEGCQTQMVAKLREYMNEHKEFKGAFDFKLLSTSNGHKLDNIVIYLNSKRHDPKLFKKFIDGYAEKIKNIISDEEVMPTVFPIKKGIGISAEPNGLYRHIYRLTTTISTEIPAAIKKGISRYPFVEKMTNASIEDEETKGMARVSWSECCSRFLILSAYIARHRLKRTDKDRSVLKDAQVQQEMDKVFKEFMILSGIDPATMMLKSNENYIKVFESNK